MTTLPRPAAVIFDLDGTLLDTAPDLHRALNHVLEAHNQPLVSFAKARPAASHGSTGMLTLGFGAAFNATTEVELREAFLTAYAQDPYSGTNYFAGVEALLQQLQDQEVPYGIVTNKPTQFTHALLPHFPLLEASGVVVCGDTLAVAKPDPAPLVHAAKALGVSPEDCWYVGDAERDIVAGRAAGMFTILASYGYICPTTDTPHLWLADSSIDAALGLADYF